MNKEEFELEGKKLKIFGSKIATFSTMNFRVGDLNSLKVVLS